MTISCPALNPKLCSSYSPSCVSLPVVASTHVRRLSGFLRTIRPSPPARQQTRHARAHRAANATRVMRRWLQPDPLKPLPGAGPWSPSAAGRCRNGGQLQRLRDAAGRVPFWRNATLPVPAKQFCRRNFWTFRKLTVMGLLSPLSRPFLLFSSDRRSLRDLHRTITSKRHPLDRVTIPSHGASCTSRE